MYTRPSNFVAVLGALVMGLVVLGPMTPALGQEAPPPVDAELFSPQPDDLGWFSTATPRSLDLGGFAGGAWASYSRSPLVIYSPSGDTEVVRDLWTVYLQAAVGFGVGDLGVSLPIHAQIAGDAWWGWGGEAVEGAAVGDMELVPKVRLLDPEVRGFGIGASIPITLPTGDETRYVGQAKATAAPMLLVAGHLGPVRLGANVGYRFAPEVELLGTRTGRGFTYRGAFSVHPHPAVAILGEVAGDVSPGDGAKPTWWLAGLRVRPTEGVAVSLAGGSSMGPIVTTPRFRLVFGASVTPVMRRDRDGDGIVDRRDECPDTAEDVDGDRDADGCVDAGRLVEVTVPSGAWVQVPHPQCTRIHPPDGLAELDLHPDVGYVEVGADGFLPTRLELPGTAALTLGSVELEPEPALGTVVFNARGPSGEVPDGARLSVGEVRRAMADGRAVVNLEPGRYPAEVGAAGFQEVTLTADVAAGYVTFARVDLPTSATPVDPATSGELPQATAETGTLDLGLRIYFATGDTAISAAAADTLEDLARRVLASPEAGDIEVVGMADPPGSPEVNARLSRSRAEAARTRLITLGVPADRLRLSVANPYADGAAPGEDQERRRVEFRLAPAGEKER